MMRRCVIGTLVILLASALGSPSGSAADSPHAMVYSSRPLGYSWEPTVTGLTLGVPSAATAHLGRAIVVSIAVRNDTGTVRLIRDTRPSYRVEVEPLAGQRLVPTSYVGGYVCSMCPGPLHLEPGHTAVFTIDLSERYRFSSGGPYKVIVSFLDPYGPTKTPNSLDVRKFTLEINT